MTRNEWEELLAYRKADGMSTLNVMHRALGPAGPAEWIEGNTSGLGKPARRLLLAVVEAVQYRNVVWLPRDDMAIALGTSPGALYRQLRTLQGIVKVDTPRGGLPPYGEQIDDGVRVSVMPAICYRWYAREDWGAREMSRAFRFEIGASLSWWIRMVVMKSEAVQREITQSNEVKA